MDEKDRLFASLELRIPAPNSVRAFGEKERRVSLFLGGAAPLWRCGVTLQRISHLDRCTHPTGRVLGDRFEHARGFDFEHRAEHDQDRAGEALLQMLRAVREEAGLTQVELAAKLGQTQSFVSKIERGDRRLDIVQLRTVCQVFGLSLQAFVKRWEAELDQ